MGSLILTLLGIAVATPIGVMAGTYLAEYGKGSKLADLIRFINDILLLGAVDPDRALRLRDPRHALQGLLRLGGSAALAIIALPVIVRTTEDMLRLVPNHACARRPAALVPRAPRRDRQICWRAAKAGIVTGILLALARIAGETARSCSRR